MMNQMVFVLYSGAIHLEAERDLKLTILSVVTSAIDWSEGAYAISSFNLMTELLELIPDVNIIPWIYKSP